jgi:hypothetical protein
MMPPRRSKVAAAIWDGTLLPVHRNNTRTGD